MSFGVFQQLAPSAVVDCSTCASFTSPGASNLVLCRGERLEVYHLLQKQNRLRLAFATNLAGRAEALATIRPRPGAPENLVILFRRASYLVVLRYEQALGSIQTCGQHLLISTAVCHTGDTSMMFSQFGIVLVDSPQSKDHQRQCTQMFSNDVS
eukprot:s871_g3.t1